MRVLALAISGLMLLSGAKADWRYSPSSGWRYLPAEEVRRSEPTVELKGTMSFYRALSILANSTGMNVIIDKDVEDTEIAIAVKGKVSEVVESLCRIADVWCDYDPLAKRLEVKKYRDMVIDIDPEGRVVFAYGSGAVGTGVQGTPEGPASAEEGPVEVPPASGGTASAFPVSYVTMNVHAQEFLRILSEYMQVRYYPSPSGYVVVKVTPSQWEDIRRFFEEKERREEVVQVEVKLLRVDLKDEFRWGINWEAVLSGFRVGSVNRLAGGVLFNPLIEQDNRATGSQGVLAVVTDEGNVGGIISALSEYGRVHTVDTWVYQMKTGTPIPFGNFRTVTYFTLGVSQAQASTEVIAEPRQEVVGFTGVLAVFKKEKGYYVEGFVEISSLLGFATQQTPYGELKAPEKEGKNFRISTYISDLDRVLLVGGFRVSGVSSKEQGVPLLSEVPLLGWLFKYKEDLSQNSEFVVLISLKKAREIEGGGGGSFPPAKEEREFIEEEDYEDLL